MESQRTVEIRMYFFVTAERQGSRPLQERIRKSVVFYPLLLFKSIAMQWFPTHQTLIEKAHRLREEAAKIPDGLARDLLLQEAFRAETAANVERFLSSPIGN